MRRIYHAGDLVPVKNTRSLPYFLSSFHFRIQTRDQGEILRIESGGKLFDNSFINTAKKSLRVLLIKHTDPNPPWTQQNFPRLSHRGTIFGGKRKEALQVERFVYHALRGCEKRATVRKYQEALVTDVVESGYIRTEYNFLMIAGKQIRVNDMKVWFRQTGNRSTAV